MVAASGRALTAACAFYPQSRDAVAGHPTVGRPRAGVARPRSPRRRHRPTGNGADCRSRAGRHSLRGERPSEAELTAPAAPLLRDAPALGACARLVGLDKRDVVRARQASAGAEFLIVEVASLRALERAVSPSPAEARALGGPDANGTMLFTRRTTTSTTSRTHVAPFTASPSTATGSAAAALAGMLALTDVTTDGWVRWRIGQGLEMGRPSLLVVRARQRRTVAEIRVAGAAVAVAEG